MEGVEGARFRISGFRFRVSGFWFLVSGFGLGVREVPGRACLQSDIERKGNNLKRFNDFDLEAKASSGLECLVSAEFARQRTVTKVRARFMGKQCRLNNTWP